MTYRNVTNQTLTIPGVGVVEPQGTITTDREINNVNLEPVEEAPHDAELSSLTRKQLNELAKERGLDPDNYSSKTELREALEA